MCEDSRYDPGPFQKLLSELLEKAGESRCKASLASGLPFYAISRFMRGVRPSQHDCVALADHFGVNPNELLRAAGYKPFSFFEPSLVPPGEMCPEVQELAEKLQQIEDPDRRRRVMRAMESLVEAYLRAAERSRK